MYIAEYYCVINKIDLTDCDKIIILNASMLIYSNYHACDMQSYFLSLIKYITKATLIYLF